MRVADPNMKERVTASYHIDLVKGAPSHHLHLDIQPKPVGGGGGKQGARDQKVAQCRRRGEQRVHPPCWGQWLGIPSPRAVQGKWTEFPCTGLT